MKTIKLTKGAIAAIVPSERPQMYATAITWLKLLALPTGVKSWVYMRRDGGRLVKLTLGRCNLMTPEQARDAAMSLASGKHEPACMIAIGALWDRWMDAREPSMRPNTLLSAGVSRKMIAPLESMRMSVITAEVAAKFHRKLVDQHGASAARSTMAWLVAACNWYSRNVEEIANPFRLVKTGKATQRRRILHGGELSQFLAALDDYPHQWFRDFVHLALLTGARKTNVIEINAKDINQKNREWIIPAESAKGKRDMRVPLLPQAMEIIERRSHAARNGYLFPHRSRSVAFTHFRSLCEQAGIVGLTIHDLRRTVGSAMAMRGVPLSTIAEVLGHANIKTTQIYAVIAADAARKGLESIAGLTNKNPG